jgi:glycosyltransferase involved in cell wall biosynthesis
MDGTDQRPVAAIFRAPSFNASETFVQTHAAGLRRYRPLLVGLEDKGNVRPDLAGGRLVASPAAALRLKLLGDARPLAERVAPYRPRLLHAHFATDGLLALPLAEALGVPLVTTLHGFDVSRRRTAMLLSGRLSWMRYAWLGRRLRQHGALFVAVSDAIRARALAAGFPAERTVTLRNGVDLARFSAPAAPEPGLVLHVGRLVPKKGTALLIEALRAVPEARLVVIGEGPLRGSLESQAAALGGRVAFLGALPHSAVAEWMRRAWLLAAPSVAGPDGDSEGLPTVAAEAAAAGLPAIVSDHSGLPEAVIDGETGFVVAAGDSAALADRIGRMLGAPGLRAEMAAAARRLAESRFDFERQSAALERLYDGLAS